MGKGLALLVYYEVALSVWRARWLLLCGLFPVYCSLAAFWPEFPPRCPTTSKATVLRARLVRHTKLVASNLRDVWASRRLEGLSDVLAQSVRAAAVEVGRACWRRIEGEVRSRRRTSVRPERVIFRTRPAARVARVGEDVAQLVRSYRRRVVGLWRPVRDEWKGVESCEGPCKWEEAQWARDFEDFLRVRSVKDVCCPITKELFVNPVVARDGFTYECAAIQRWIEAAGGEEAASPMTGERLASLHLVPNFALKGILKASREDFLRQKKKGRWHE